VKASTTDRCQSSRQNNENDDRNKFEVCEGHAPGASGEKGTDLARDIGNIGLLPIFDVVDSNILLKPGRSRWPHTTAVRGPIRRLQSHHRFAYLSGGDKLGLIIEDDALDVIADVSSVIDVGNVGKRYHNEATHIS
jgi:hypothetical protein